MKGSIFISYSRADADVAKALAALVARLKIEFFLDQKDLEWGDSSTKGIKDALRQCSFVLVVLSPASLKSQWVPFELGQAHALDKKILPFLTHPSLDVPTYLVDLNYRTDINELESDLRRLFKLSAGPIAYWDPEEALAVIEILAKKGLNDEEIVTQVKQYKLGKQWILDRLREIRGSMSSL